MKTIKVVLTALLLTVYSVAFAQNTTVKGVVKDASTGESLPGASVIVLGTSIGTVTDIDGNYTISVPANGVISFSSIGFKTVQKAPAGATVFNVSLEADNEFLDEVVVTAMGISREKKSLGYAVQDVKSEELIQAASSSLSGALQGKVSGVEISASSGMPGASSKITIRGSRSLDGNNSPLYVVDGMPIASTPDYSTGNSVTGADMAGRSLDIDPNDIESINILKGQAAAALYGMRASNGVIIITTKKGSNSMVGKTDITFTSNFSFDTVATLPDTQTVYAQGSAGKFSPNTSLAWGPKISELANDPNYGGNTDNQYTQKYGKHEGMYYVPQRAQAGLDPWAKPQAYNNAKDFFQTGHSFSNNVSVSRNSGNGSFALSVGNTSSEGIVPSTGLQRYNARLAADAKLGDHFTTGFTGNFVQSVLTKQSGANDGVTATVYAAPASYDLAGIPCHVAGDPYSQVHYRSLTFDNPYWAVENNKFSERSQRFFGNAYLDFKTDFGTGNTHSLDVKYQIGADAYTTSYQDIFGYGHQGSTGEITEQNYTDNTFNSLITANYNWKASENWNINALVGNEIVFSRGKELWAYGNVFNFAGWNSLNNVSSYQAGEGFGKSLTFGTFGQLAADYKSMLFLTATIRGDYVSPMPTHNRTFVYPSISAGFIFTELEALRNNVLTYGKVRASYAEVGEAGHYYNSYYSTPGFGGGFSSGTPAMYPTNGVVAYTPSSTIYDPNLRPQNTKSYEAGLDLGFFNGRITVNYTFSRQDVKDQIFAVPMASSTGYAQKVTNAGKVHTNAHELTVGFIPVQTRNFSWDIDVNFTKIDNYVDELAEGVENIMLGGFVEPQIRAGIGDKYPVIYGYDYLRNEDGVVVVDEDGFPAPGELAVLGAVSPDFVMGLSTSFNWKDLRLGLVFDWKKGGNMYAGTYTMTDYYGTSARSLKYREMDSFIFDFEPSVKEDGTPNDIQIPGAYAQSFFSTMNDISKYFVNDASYLKLREVSLSYPVVKAKWGSLTLNAFARNILLWSAIKGFDPEASQGNNNMAGGFERFSLPGSSSFGGGLTFRF